MCGRYTVIKTSEIANRFSTINESSEYASRYNAAPSQLLPVVYRSEVGVVVKTMKWGLVPAWSKEPKMKFNTINARSEGLGDSRLYKRPLKQQRCIVPADGYYEWKKTPEGSIPYYFHLLHNEMYGMAGLYEIWHAGADNELFSFTIITTSANELSAGVHDRMPVILSPEQESAWLNQDLDDEHVLFTFLKPYTSSAMSCYRVPPLVNKVSNDGPELLHSV